jgi:hypothetical protein
VQSLAAVIVLSIGCGGLGWRRWSALEGIELKQTKVQRPEGRGALLFQRMNRQLNGGISLVLKSLYGLYSLSFPRARINYWPPTRRCRLPKSCVRVSASPIAWRGGTRQIDHRSSTSDINRDLFTLKSLRFLISRRPVASPFMTAYPVSGSPWDDGEGHPTRLLGPSTMATLPGSRRRSS